jgi:hypothetical protein
MGRRFAIFEHFSGRLGIGKRAQNSTHESYGITRKAFRSWAMYKCELDYDVDVRDQWMTYCLSNLRHVRCIAYP